jgi:hypothetical protein
VRQSVKLDHDSGDLHSAAELEGAVSTNAQCVRRMYVLIQPFQLINEFLVETYDGYTEAPQHLVLITTTDWSQYSKDEARLSPSEAKEQHIKYRTYGGGPMRVPSRPPWTEEFESPFLDQTPEDVAEALRAAEGAPGEMSRDYCVMLDLQTTEDRTALLVKTKRDRGDNLPPGYGETPIVKVRETFKEANGLVVSASVGVSSLVGTLWNQQGGGLK